MTPTQLARAIPPTIPGKRPYELMIFAVVIEVRATIAPWERSIPAVKMTRNCPRAKRPITEY
jgi:hypothetical protein